MILRRFYGFNGFLYGFIKIIVFKAFLIVSGVSGFGFHFRGFLYGFRGRFFGFIGVRGFFVASL